MITYNVHGSFYTQTIILKFYTEWELSYSDADAIGRAMMVNMPGIIYYHTSQED